MNGFFTSQFLVIFLLVAAVAGAGVWHIFDIRKKIQKFLGETGINLDENTAQGLMRRVARLEAKSEELDPRVALLEDVATMSIQKIGFVRFNPFQDTGGDNSFMLVLLDRTNTGVLLSSLYMRDGIRLYAKSIEAGTPKQVLSAEEKKVLENTIHTQ